MADGTTGLLIRSSISGIDMAALNFLSCDEFSLHGELIADGCHKLLELGISGRTHGGGKSKRFEPPLVNLIFA